MSEHIIQRATLESLGESARALTNTADPIKVGDLPEIYDACATSLYEINRVLYQRGIGDASLAESIHEVAEKITELVPQDTQSLYLYDADDNLLLEWEGICTVIKYLELFTENDSLYLRINKGAYTQLLEGVSPSDTWGVSRHYLASPLAKIDRGPAQVNIWTDLDLYLCTPPTPTITIMSKDGSTTLGTLQCTGYVDELRLASGGPGWPSLYTNDPSSSMLPFLPTNSLGESLYSIAGLMDVPNGSLADIVVPWGVTVPADIWEDTTYYAYDSVSPTFTVTVLSPDGSTEYASLSYTGNILTLRCCADFDGGWLPMLLINGEQSMLFYDVPIDEDGYPPTIKGLALVPNGTEADIVVPWSDTTDTAVNIYADTTFYTVEEA